MVEQPGVKDEAGGSGGEIKRATFTNADPPAPTRRASFSFQGALKSAVMSIFMLEPSTALNLVYADPTPVLPAE